MIILLYVYILQIKIINETLLTYKLQKITTYHFFFDRNNYISYALKDLYKKDIKFKFKFQEYFYHIKINLNILEKCITI